MKFKLVLFIQVFIFSINSYAISDFERGALFLINSYSMGTMLPEMEGEIKKIQLEYEKKRAEFQNELELSRKAFLKNAINEKIAEISRYIVLFKEQKTRIETQRLVFNEVLLGSEKLYSGILTKEKILEEIKLRSIENPQIENEWQQLIHQATSDNLENLTSEDFELVFLKALEIDSLTVGLISQLDQQLLGLEQDILGFQQYLRDLK